MTDPFEFDAPQYIEDLRSDNSERDLWFDIKNNLVNQQQQLQNQLQQIQDNNSNIQENHDDWDQLKSTRRRSGSIRPMFSTPVKSNPILQSITPLRTPIAAPDLYPSLRTTPDNHPRTPQLYPMLPNSSTKSTPKRVSYQTDIVKSLSSSISNVSLTPLLEKIQNENKENINTINMSTPSATTKDKKKVKAKKPNITQQQPTSTVVVENQLTKEEKKKKKKKKTEVSTASTTTSDNIFQLGKGFTQKQTVSTFNVPTTSDVEPIPVLSETIKEAEERLAKSPILNSIKKRQSMASGKRKSVSINMQPTIHTLSPAPSTTPTPITPAKDSNNENLDKLFESISAPATIITPKKQSQPNDLLSKSPVSTTINFGFNTINNTTTATEQPTNLLKRKSLDKDITNQVVNEIMNSPLRKVQPIIVATTNNNNTTNHALKKPRVTKVAPFQLNVDKRSNEKPSTVSQEVAPSTPVTINSVPMAQRRQSSVHKKPNLTVPVGFHFETAARADRIKVPTTPSTTTTSTNSVPMKRASFKEDLKKKVKDLPEIKNARLSKNKTK